jgi:hypothetical protein
MTGELARALTGVGHRIAQACIALGAAVAAHETAPADTRSQDASLRPRLDALAGTVAAVTGQLAEAVRELGTPGAHMPPSQFPLLRGESGGRPPEAAPRGESGGRPPEAALRRESGGRPPEAAPRGESGDLARAGGADLTGLGGEAAGLLAATDSLVDAIETGAEILRHPEEVA